MGNALLLCVSKKQKNRFPLASFCNNTYRHLLVVEVHSCRWKLLIKRKRFQAQLLVAVWGLLYE